MAHAPQHQQANNRTYEKSKEREGQEISLGSGAAAAARGCTGDAAVSSGSIMVVATAASRDGGRWWEVVERWRCCQMLRERRGSSKIKRISD